MLCVASFSTSNHLRPAAVNDIMGVGRDMHTLNIRNCTLCGAELHKTNYQRILWNAVWLDINALRFNATGAWLDLIFIGDTSHLCHNGPCSDPFHLTKESRKWNLQRKSCVDSGKCFCALKGAGLAACRLDRYMGKGRDWAAERLEIQKNKAQVSEVLYKCSASCTPAELHGSTSGWKGFTSFKHWNGCASKNGRVCKNGGHIMLR